jgi:hypothetical protein
MIGCGTEAQRRAGAATKRYPADREKRQRCDRRWIGAITGSIHCDED